MYAQCGGVEYRYGLLLPFWNTSIYVAQVQKATRFNNTAQQPIQSPQRFQLGL